MILWKFKALISILVIIQGYRVFGVPIVHSFRVYGPNDHPLGVYGRKLYGLAVNSHTPTTL